MKNESMRIEMVLPSLAAAGMEVMVARMAKKLASRGHDVGVTCVLEKGQLAAEVEAAGVRVSDPGAQGLADGRWLTRLTSHFNHIRPDVVHIHSGAWFKGASSARAARVRRVVYTAHGYISGEQRAETVLNRVAVYLTDQVVSVSNELVAVMRARRLAGKRITVIANGIDLDHFKPAATAPREIRSKFEIAPSTMLIGTVARLESIKNQAMLLDGLALARHQGVDAACVLIGDGSLRDELAAQAARLGISDHVHFWGLDTNVARLYSELDVFTLTSDAEGTSISLLEAMASGVCPLATSVGGNPAVVGDAGMLVAARRPDELAAALSRLARNPAERASLAATARTRVAEKFSDETMLDAYERVYRG